MPLISAGQLALFSPCLPDYRQIYYYLEILGCVVAGFACIGLFVYCVKWHDPQQWTERQNKVFVGVLGWVSFFAWIFAGFSLYSDAQLLWRMQRYVLSELTNCAHVNYRSVFFSFMSQTDVFPGFTTESSNCSSLVRYYSSAGPNSLVDPTIPSNISNNCFNGWPFTLTPPPLTQLYTNYSLSLQEWQKAGFFPSIKPSVNNAAFTYLCQLFSPYCHVITPVDDLLVCADAWDQSQWSSKTHFVFLIFVVIILTWKLALEAGKCIIIIVSMWNKQLWQPFSLGGLAFIRDSPCMILFPAVGMCYSYNPWREVFAYDMRSGDAKLAADQFWRLFVINGILGKAPMMGLTIWWIKKVTQTGLQPFDYFSLFGGSFALLLGLGRACYILYQTRVANRYIAASDGADAGVPLRLPEASVQESSSASSDKGPRKTYLQYWSEVDRDRISLNSSYSMMEDDVASQQSNLQGEFFNL
jgi:hypothetical protein